MNDRPGNPKVDPDIERLIQRARDQSRYVAPVAEEIVPDTYLAQHRQILVDKGIDAGLIDLVCVQPTTKEAFREFIEKALGHRFARGRITMALNAVDRGPEDKTHTIPMDWLWGIYCLGCGRSKKWNELDKKRITVATKEFLLKGPRGGMKTLALAVLWFTLCWFLEGYSTTHTATERPQALTCLAYVLAWAKSRLFEDGITKANSKVGAEYTNGSRFVVLTASFDGLNHEHTLSISLDEVETFSEELMQQALQIQQEQVGCPWPSLVILASTQKKPTMGMARLIKEHQKTGKYKYILWSCWDVAECCEDWRREDIEKIGLKCDDYPRLVERLAAAVSAGEAGAQGAKKIEENILALQTNCPLVRDCQGKLIGASGHLSINTLRQRIVSLDRNTWVAENLCQAASRRNAIYEHLGEENISEDAIYRPGKRVIAGVDYGLVTNPSVAVFACLNDIYVDQFDEWEGRNMFEEELVEKFWEFQKRYAVGKWIVDNNAIKLAQFMRRRGMNAVRSSRQRILKGIDHCAQLICSGSGLRRRRFHPVGARTTYDAMFAYVKRKGSDEPVDKNDDYPDADRYMCEDVRVRATAPPVMVKRGKRPGRSTGRRPRGR